uniref:Uncharacterized protein K0122H06.3 n=1 Tax=Oryza sativa subsp. indica TaxID=39946 RepID=C8TFD2_ORYSI|nr:hypothetical protein [Oryza sativa Indica Group]
MGMPGGYPVCTRWSLASLPAGVGQSCATCRRHLEPPRRLRCAKPPSSACDAILLALLPIVCCLCHYRRHMPGPPLLAWAATALPALASLLAHALRSRHCRGDLGRSRRGEWGN